MKLLRLREKLNHIGLVLLELEHGGFRVTDAAPPVDLTFADLAAVEQWIKDQRHANRLTDADDAEWDAQFKAYVEEWRDVKCQACECVHPKRLWLADDGCCPSCGEGQVI